MSERDLRPNAKVTREFLSEAEDLLERLRSGLADLADSVSAEEPPAPDVLNGLFRAAHSLKGLAGMFAVEGVGALAHQLEEVLDALRLGRLAPARSSVALLEEAVEQAAAWLEWVSSPQSPSPGLESAQDLVERVRRLLEGPAEPPSAAAPGSPAEALELDPSIRRALTEYEEHRLGENLRQGRWVHLVEVTFEILSFEQKLSDLTATLREAGEVISTLPAPGDVSEAQIRFSLLVATTLDPDELGERVETHHASVRALNRPHPEEARSHPEEARSTPASRRPAPEAEGAPEESTESSREVESLRSISDTVRVDIRKLDELMNLVGELVIQRAAVGSVASRLLADETTRRFGSELAKLHKTFDRKLQDLQARILDVRMVPLRQVFERLTRVARRLRRELGKEVNLEIRGADTELDKLLVEELVDPLMHVVRNAFDHAIEPPEERVAAGKPAAGTIQIEAFQSGSHVVVQVRDDGRGIDTEAVRARALELGLIGPEDTCSRKELLELVFAPGLSTRSEVSATSGRGVGMDVVRANLVSLGGIVDVDSQLSRGTTISFTLPITLAIIQALLVRVTTQRFAIPLTAVLETLPLEPGTLQRSQGHELLHLRGEPLPVRWLHDEFGWERTPGGKPYVVVVGLGDARLGLVVDRLDGQQDAVIKPIQGPYRTVRGIAGATELGDEGIVLVLDVAGLIEASGRVREAA